MAGINEADGFPNKNAEARAPRGPQESIVQRIGRLYGAESRVMLHDSPSESGPLLPPSSQSEDVALDDSQYQVLGYIAKGGVGVVYKARDKNLGREVALKILRSDRITSGAHVAERLVEEAQVGGQLQHPGVVPVYSIGMQKDGRPHFAMKLIKGATFSQLLQDRPDPQQDQPKFLAQFEQLCYTMAYCHARGVIHRDLKPSNIM
ncbi:MAG: protein kinase domain-containing protein, partial [Planctomycetota bacterium]